MKKKIPVVILLSSFLLFSCAQNLRFDQTCLTCIKSQRFSCAEDECPKTFMVGDQCLVTIVETGENIFLNPILDKELISPATDIPVAIAKLNGYVYLTANGFSKLWILEPEEDNKAEYKSIDLPLPDTKIQNPVFSLDLKNYLLKLTADNYSGKTYVLEDGKWSVVNGGKAGE